MASRLSLREQVLRRLDSGDPPIAQKFHPLEVDEAILQAINTQLKPQFFENMKLDGSEALGHVIVTYDNVPVVAYKGVSKCTLPFIPVALPKNMGIQRVYNATDINNTAFIPATSAQMELIASQKLLSDLMGQTAYKPRGKELIFNKDLTAQSPAITSVSIELVVMDYTNFTDYELLPLDASMASDVVNMVVAMLIGEQNKPQVIDSTSNTK